MKKFFNNIKPWLFPSPDSETDKEIITMNLSNIYYLSMVIGIVQIILLIIFYISNRSNIQESSVVSSMVNVTLSVIICFIASVISGILLNKRDFYEKHRFVARLFEALFFIVLMIWGIAASINTFERGNQIVTFYIVEVVVILYVKLKPIFTVPVVLCSYTVFYLSLNYIKPGTINFYNLLMLAFISVIGAVINYRHTVVYIEQKNKANLLNKSLEVIANHDSTTRLQNRYALNQQVSEYVNSDLCIAIGDINKFKSVNDTYGHTMGDDVLKAFADILLETFSDTELYRYGGDEFLVVQTGVDFAGFCEKLEEINERFSDITVNGTDLSLGCSFGAVEAHPETPGDFFAQINIADAKLYDVKNKKGLDRR